MTHGGFWLDKSQNRSVPLVVDFLRIELSDGKFLEKTGRKKMKLAEALIRRKDLQTRVSRLRDRLFANVKYQEGDKPSEDPNELIALLNQTLDELNDIICRINRTNGVTEVNGEPIADAITRRDTALRKIGIMREVLNRAADRPDRYSKSEIRILTCINVKEQQEIVDELAHSARLLDARIQAKNWETELL